MFDVHSDSADKRSRIESSLLAAMELERRRCKEDFAFFARRFWHTIEPSTQYVHGPHIEAIVDHLTACLPRVRFEERIDRFTGRPMKVRIVQPGQIRKLLINMPPRHMKSTLVSVLWPAWVWTFRPDVRWFFTSYALTLATRDTMRMRAVISSPRYQLLFGDSFRLLVDQNAKDRFYNTAMGYRMIGSPEAGVTGEGGDLVVCDDAINARDADSETVRERTRTWWFESMSTRLNDAATGGFIVVMQRVHEKDLSAYCKDAGYVHLNLPARYDSSRSCSTVLGWHDWRKTDGELLWPARFPERVMQTLETDLGEYGVASQLQQDPKPRGGAFIKRDWFKRIPADALRFIGAIAWGRSWDLALSKNGDGVASVDYGVGPDGEVYLRRGLFWHLDLPDTLARIEMVARQEHGQMVFESIGTTKTAGAEGAKAAGGHAVTSLIEEKDNKVSMAMPWIAMAQAGKVFFVEETEDSWPLFSFNSGPWIEHFLDRFCAWIPDPTLSQRDDEVDSVSLAYKKFGGNVPLDRVLKPHGVGSSISSADAAPFRSGYEEDDFDDLDGDEGSLLGGGYSGGML